MSDIWNWVKARLMEPSTWAGLSVAALAVSTGLANHYSIGAIVGGVVAAVLKEKSA